MPPSSPSFAVRFRDVGLGFGARSVLEHVTFTLSRGDHVALVGANGAGKTSLLRLIAGGLSPEYGEVELGVSPRELGWLRQELRTGASSTVGEVLDEAEPELTCLRGALASAIERGDGADVAAAASAYDDAGGWESEARRAEVVGRLGVASLPEGQRLESLSGGEQTRLGLAALVLRRPSLLLLDEPTNHLDLEGLLWLEDELASYPGAVILVSHDRVFLDRVANRTFVLDAGRFEDFRGTYGELLEERRARHRRERDAYERQQREVARLSQAALRVESSARSIEHATIDFAVRAKAARKARQATVIKRRIQRELAQHTLEKPRRGWTLKLDLQAASETGQIVMSARDLRVEYGARVVLDGVDVEVMRGERVAVVGPNGAGKSTLLRVFVGDLEPSHGQVGRGPSVRIGYVAQGREPLDAEQTVLDVIKAAGRLDDSDARTFAHFLLFAGNEVFTPTGRLSAGERARLAVGALVLGDVNALVLDEPTNHLDLDAQASLATVLEQYKGALVVASHNRAFLNEIGIGRVLELRGGRVHAWLSLDDYLASIE